MKLNVVLFIFMNIIYKFLNNYVYPKNYLGYYYLYLKNIYFLVTCIKILKKHSFSQINLLVDCCILDKPFLFHRYELIYNFQSLSFNYKLFIKIFLLQNQFNFSLTSLFLNSNWIEREIWDMFGIIFINHPDLRRILSDYGFDGHPLKKDFPLTGFLELQFDDLIMALKYVTIELMQDFRIFWFLSPWEEIKFNN